MGGEKKEAMAVACSLLEKEGRHLAPEGRGSLLKRRGCPAEESSAASGKVLLIKGKRDAGSMGKRMGTTSLPKEGKAPTNAPGKKPSIQEVLSRRFVSAGPRRKKDLTPQLTK